MKRIVTRTLLALFALHIVTYAAFEEALSLPWEGSGYQLKLLVQESDLSEGFFYDAKFLKFFADERIAVYDAHNAYLHVFDATGFHLRTIPMRKHINEFKDSYLTDYMITEKGVGLLFRAKRTDGAWRGIVVFVDPDFFTERTVMKDNENAAIEDVIAKGVRITSKRTRDSRVIANTYTFYAYARSFNMTTKKDVRKYEPIFYSKDVHSGNCIYYNTKVYLADVDGNRLTDEISIRQPYYHGAMVIYTLHNFIYYNKGRKTLYFFKPDERGLTLLRFTDA